MSGISRDEWLKALQEVGIERENDPDALTIDEFAAMFGMARTTAQHRLERLVAAGKATATTKRQRTRNGRLLSFRAFKLERA